RSARPRARPPLAPRGVALQDGAPRLPRRGRQGGAAARLAAPLLQRRGAHSDVRLVPRESRTLGRGRHDAPRAVEPARARGAEENQLMEREYWDELFAEMSLLPYAPLDRGGPQEEEALAAARLAGCAPGADVLDAPCGYGRHSIP